MSFSLAASVSLASSSPILSLPFCGQVRQKHCFVGCHAGPEVQFADPGVALGLVQLGHQMTQIITIHNTSQFSPATWTLHALPQQASSSSASSSNSAAQHAQQGAERYQGMPAVLEAKQEQQLQEEACVTEQEAAPEADIATSAQSGNPFEDSPAAEEQEEECGCSLLIQPECGILAAGASATVQVGTCHQKLSNDVGLCCNNRCCSLGSSKSASGRSLHLCAALSVSPLPSFVYARSCRSAPSCQSMPILAPSCLSSCSRCCPSQTVASTAIGRHAHIQHLRQLYGPTLHAFRRCSYTRQMRHFRHSLDTITTSMLPVGNVIRASAHRSNPR